MLTELFHIELPELFNKLFAMKQLTIYSYPFCILVGSILAYHYFLNAQKKLIGKAHLKLGFALSIGLVAYLGGKVFLLFENNDNYYEKVQTLTFYTSSGFVFYGSFIFCVIYMLYLLKKKRLPILKYLDIIAIVTAIVHAFGRLGCFLAGCCHGKITDSFLGVQFPKNEMVSVHPTQLYEALFVGILVFVLLKLIKQKRVGTTFTTYILAYAIWRFIIEFLRGDKRAYVFNDLLSHSQLISIVLSFLIITFILIKPKQSQFTR